MTLVGSGVGKDGSTHPRLREGGGPTDTVSLDPRPKGVGVGSITLGLPSYKSVADPSPRLSPLPIPRS